MMSLWDALRMNMMISYQELVRTFPNNVALNHSFLSVCLRIHCQRKIIQHILVLSSGK